MVYIGKHSLTRLCGKITHCGIYRNTLLVMLSSFGSLETFSKDFEFISCVTVSEAGFLGYPFIRQWIQVLTYCVSQLSCI